MNTMCTWSVSVVIDLGARGRVVINVKIRSSTPPRVGRLHLYQLQTPSLWPSLGHQTPQPLPRVPAQQARGRNPARGRPIKSMQGRDGTHRHRGVWRRPGGRGRGRRMGHHPPLPLLRRPAHQPHRRRRRRALTARPGTKTNRKSSVSD